MWVVGLILIGIRAAYWWGIANDDTEVPAHTPTATPNATREARAATSTAVSATQAAANPFEIDRLECEFVNQIDVECKVWFTRRPRSRDAYVQLIATAYDTNFRELEEARRRIDRDSLMGLGKQLIYVAPGQDMPYGGFMQIDYHTIEIFNVPSATTVEVGGWYSENQFRYDMSSSSGPLSLDQ